MYYDNVQLLIQGKLLFFLLQEYISSLFYNVLEQVEEQLYTLHCQISISVLGKTKTTKYLYVLQNMFFFLSRCITLCSHFILKSSFSTSRWNVFFLTLHPLQSKCCIVTWKVKHKTKVCTEKVLAEQQCCMFIYFFLHVKMSHSTKYILWL